MNELRVRLNQERMALQNIQDYYNKKIDYDKTIKRLEKLYGYDILFVLEKEDIAECYERISSLSWSEAEVDEKLHTIMKNIHDNSVKAVEENGLGYNLVVGANIAGFAKVADAMIQQGII
jgi:hypothetical protein